MATKSFRVPVHALLAGCLLLAVSALPVLAASAQNTYGHTILALYKSSDGQTALQNEAVWFLAPVLVKMGFTVRYWDISNGPPSQRELSGVRAIVSWFRGDSMRHPIRYLEFLNKSMDSGRKVVVIGNLGAYRDRATGKYLNPIQINPTLERLGIIYLGGWTGDAGKIKIAFVNARVAEYQGRQDPARSDLYYHFRKVGDAVNVFLSLRRTDRDYGPSPVIVTNGDGGFALSDYIYRQQKNGKVLMLLNLRAFMESALFPKARSERVALLVDSSSSNARRIVGFTRPMLRRDKIPCDVIGASSLADLMPGDLRKYTAVGLALMSDASLDPAVLKSYLEGGGSVVVLQTGNYSRNAQLLAMGREIAAPGRARGYSFAPGFVLGNDYVPRDDSFGWQPGNRLPASNATVLATSGTRFDRPLLWAASVYNGKVLVWNWDALSIGDFQGLILESFLYVRPVGIAATAGIGAMYIDDFPQPMYNVVKPPEKITDTQFYTKVWFPQIRKVFADHHMPFSAFTVFSYNADVSPPFPIGEYFVGNHGSTVKLAREVLASNNELGLHGYNHQSLTLAKTILGSRPWPSVKDMVEGLDLAKRTWIALYGRYSLPFSYVAPNDIISPDGIAALHEAFPTIHVVCSLRYTGGTETATDFGPDPKIPTIYFIPRNSWGYEYTPGARMRVASAASGPGIWAHFIHPDDVFDPNRSDGLRWNQLRENFVQLLDFAKRNYPWLHYVTLRGAYEALRKMDASDATFQWSGKRMTIRGTPGLLLRVRTNIGPITSMNGVKLVYRYENMPETILRLTASVATLDFGR